MVVIEKLLDMCFDQIEMSSREYGKIAYDTILNDNSEHLYSNEVRRFEAHGAYGAIIHDEVREKYYSLWRCRYLIRKDTTLTMSSDRPVLSLNFVLKNEIAFRLRGLPEGFMTERQYNLIYLPRFKCEYMFRKNEEYRIFGIHYSPDYLEQWNSLSAALTHFLDAVKAGKPVMMSRHEHPFATGEMKTVIWDILRCMYEEPLRKMRLEAKSLELLEASLAQLNARRAAPLPLADSDIDKIRRAHRLLSERIDQSFTLRSLAQEVGTNVFKLKTGFKWLYGTAVFAFLREERMQKARKALVETDMPVYSIALMIGYKNHANFTAAFKKRFGYPPSALRSRS